jgi:hypothetical protein
VKNNRTLRISAYVIIVFTLLSCTTTPLSFVKQRMVGTWIRTPIIPDQPESIQKWQFTDDGYLLLINNLPDSVTFGTGLDPTSIYSDSVEWNILWPLTKHFLQLKMEIPGMLRTPPPENIVENDSLMALYEQGQRAKLYIQKWEIIKINKRILHLVLHSSGKETGLANNAITLVGGQQIIFVRE